MIFSLSDKLSTKLIFKDPETDIFCFFHSENAVKIPESFWLHAVAVSLRMKKNVLILERNIDQFPSINMTQRWQIEDGHLWLAPRSLSVLLEATNGKSVTYPVVKALLTHHK